MEHVLNTISSPEIKGHLEIIKLYSDGREEVHFSEDNIITSGMGYTLLRAFESHGAGSISSFQIVYFQLGVSGAVTLQASGNGSLSSSLDEAEYGAANFEIDNHDLWASGVNQGEETFGIIPFPYIKKISPTRVMYQIFVGEDACNAKTLNEIGLFSRNPDNLVTEGSYLCAYRYFTPLEKVDQFSVLFRWTIEF